MISPGTAQDFLTRRVWICAFLCRIGGRRKAIDWAEFSESAIADGKSVLIFRLLAQALWNARANLLLAQRNV